MTLSIDVLPAPFGPMIARISWRRISTLISLSALTPPKARLMPSALSSASPMSFCAACMATGRWPCPSTRPCGPAQDEGRRQLVPRDPHAERSASQASRRISRRDTDISARLAQSRCDRGDRHRLRRADLEVGFEHALAAVLEGDLGFDMRAAAVAIERLDQRLVALADE